MKISNILADCCCTLSVPAQQCVCVPGVCVFVPGVCALSVSALAFAKHEVLCKYLSINVFYLALFQFASATQCNFPHHFHIFLDFREII